MEILIVEDDSIDFRLIQSAIARLDFPEALSLERVDCEEDFSVLVEGRELEQFHAIVMDVLLPWTRPGRATCVPSRVPQPPFDAGIRNCRLMHERGFSIPVLLCSNISKGDLELISLPEFVKFSPKVELETQIRPFLETVHSSKRHSTRRALA